jgi:hypothetical protein
MSRSGIAWILPAVALLTFAAAGCSGQQTETPQPVAEQAPPPSSTAAEAQNAEIPPPPPTAPPKTVAKRPAQSIPEERPRRVVPQPAPEPATVTVTIPQGASLAVQFDQEVTSASAQVGDPVTARLKAPVIVGDRVVFPADSRVEGKVVDVKPATKGFKDTSGALAVTFERVVAPDGHTASIAAGFTKVAEGSGKKKAAIIGGSAAGGALLGKVLGKDAKGAALLGGAIGTAVAGGTKGKEAILTAGEELDVALERAAKTTLKR